VSLKQHNSPLRPADRRGNLLGIVTVIYKYCEKGWEAEIKTCCESEEKEHSLFAYRCWLINRFGSMLKVHIEELIIKLYAKEIIKLYWKHLLKTW